MSLRRRANLAIIPALIVISGCQKRITSPARPDSPLATPTQAAATADRASTAITEFMAEPSSIVQGQSAILRWQVKGDITSVKIDQIGDVESSGSHQVSPKSSTTYRLTAEYPSGALTALAIVRVVPPPPPANSGMGTSTLSRSLEDRLSADLQDVYFDYDSSNLRDDARENLVQDATVLKTILATFPNTVIVLEGHCDERGSAEYNVALGDRRAASAKDFLVQFGISPNRLTFVSFGKEQPQCAEVDEVCWQRNRRVHFASGRE